MGEDRGTKIGMCTGTLLADAMAATEDQIRGTGEAALAVGCTEASVWSHHVPILAGLGLQITVVEAAMQWATGSADEAKAEAEQLAGLAASVGAPLIAAATFATALEDLGPARDNLAHLVDVAAGVGARVCVEFLPWTAVGTLARAWELVEPLGDGAGILLDTWHWTRQPGGPDLGVLATIPGDRVPYVQLCDAAAEAGDDLFAEAMSARLVPGEGVVDFGAVLGQLDAIGARPFIATEVFNPGLVRDRGAEGAARAMVAGAAQLFT